MSLKTVKVNKNVLDVLVPINPQCPDKNKKSIKLKCSNCNGDHVASSRDCPKFKDQTKIQADRAKARQEKRVDDSLIQRLLVEHRIMLNYDRYKRARPSRTPIDLIPDYLETLL